MPFASSSRIARRDALNGPAMSHRSPSSSMHAAVLNLSGCGWSSSARGSPGGEEASNSASFTSIRNALER